MPDRFFEDAPPATPRRTKQRAVLGVDDATMAQALGLRPRELVGLEQRLDSHLEGDRELAERWDRCLGEILAAREG